MHHPLGPILDVDDRTDLTDPVRHELVAESAAIFGEEADREPARRLRVPFEATQLEVQP